MTYARSSRAAARSVASQTDKLMAVISKLDWTLAGEFDDDGRSASRFARRARPQYAMLFRLLESDDRPDVLMLWEASRGSREMAGWVELLDLCRRHRIQIWLHTDERLYDQAIAADRRALLAAGADSEHETEKLSGRVTRGILSSADNGRPHSHVAYAHRREYDQTNGEFVRTVLEPAEATILLAQAEAILTGKASLSALGRKYGQHYSTIRARLLNPIYTGARVHKGRLAKVDAFPALWDEDTAIRLSAILRAEDRKTFQADGRARYLISGYGQCGVCGGKLKRHPNNRNSERPSYVCRAGRCVTVVAAVLDHWIICMLTERIATVDPDALVRPTGNAGAEEFRAAKEHLRELTERLDAAVDEATAGRLSAASLGRMESRLLPEIEEAQRSMQRSAAEAADVPAAVLDLLNAGEQADGHWRTLTTAEQRVALALLVDPLVVGRGRKGRLPFDPRRLGESHWRGDGMSWAERNPVTFG